MDTQYADRLQDGRDLFPGAPSSRAFRIWRRVPGAYMWVHDASTAMARNSSTFGSSTPDVIVCAPIAMNFSVQTGSSSAIGSHAAFQLPVLRSWSQMGVATALSLIVRLLSVEAAPRLGAWVQVSETGDLWI
ncbi:hypothetical protein AWV79_21505 [Cupriavidus sp. UYMMa02A]|nr:hypothetical protein AWV79_21505 [Cupriavidus sp. UYMMa02A]